MRYTSGAFIANAGEATNYFNTLVSPPDQRPGHLLHDVFPGDSKIDTLKCNQAYSGDMTLDWKENNYSFGEEYAVWGWARSDSTCDKPETLFRFVIDVPDEGKKSNGYTNPNYA